MNRWTKIETREFAQSRRAKDGGIKIEVSLSPYDIPEAVRGEYCPDRRKFVISFKYLTSEDTKSRRIGEHILAKEGVESERLIELEIDITALDVHQVELEVTPILKDFYDSLPVPESTNSLNCPIPRERVTGEIIERYRDEIFA